MTSQSDNGELRLHPGWWARLEGEALDLEALAKAFGDESSVQVRKFDGRYYVRMAEFDGIPESADVETRASEVLRVVNGAARVQHGNNAEVRIDAAAHVKPDGSILHTVHLSGSIRSRSRMTASLTVNGEPAPGTREASVTERATELALNDPQAERALRIFGRDDVDYRDLYHVLEIAEAAIGGGMYADGTVTREEVRRFKHTANSVHALGDQARHGHEATQPPLQPTPFADAMSLIGRILRVWLAPPP